MGIVTRKERLNKRQLKGDEGVAQEARNNKERRRTRRRREGKEIITKGGVWK